MEKILNQKCFDNVVTFCILEEVGSIELVFAMRTASKVISQLSDVSVNI